MVKQDMVVKTNASNDPVAVVHYVYMANCWQEVAAEQFARLKASGLYDAAAEYPVEACGPDAEVAKLHGMLESYPKAKLTHHKDNRFEYPGIARVKAVGDAAERCILYFHTKGTGNIYRDFSTKEVSPRKLRGQQDWRRRMEYFLVDRWRESVALLDGNDVVGAGVNSPANGNFWWTTSRFVRTRQPVHSGWDRWRYENWLPGMGERPPVQHSWYKKHCILAPGALSEYSDCPSWFYDGSRDLSKEKLVVVGATYGLAAVQLNENGAKPLGNAQLADVTERVRAACNGRKISIVVGNADLGGDPAPGKRKEMDVKLALASDPDTVYEMAFAEGVQCSLDLDAKLAPMRP